MKTALKASLLTAFSFVLFLSARSQTTASHNVSMVLSDVITLSMTGGDVSMSFTTVADYNDGVPSAQRTLTVSSNKAYKITAYATSAAPTSGDLTTGTVHIPLSALTIQEGTNGYIALTNSSTSPATLVANHAAGGAQATLFNYKANPGYGHAAGTYTTNVTFTASQL